MGFLDEIKNKMHLGGQQGYDQGYGQDDDYGYDDGYDDSYQGNGYSGASGEGFYTQDEPSNGLLGQTRRGEAESVAVYTRSGQLVGDDSRHATTYNPPSRSQDSVASGYRPGAYDTRRATPRTPAPVPPLHPRLHRAMPRPMRAISSTPRRSCRPMFCAPRAMTTWRPWCAAFAPSSLSH